MFAPSIAFIDVETTGTTEVGCQPCSTRVRVLNDAELRIVKSAGVRSARVGDLVREVARQTTILLIEHNMDVVMELAQRITVMENGAILADGSPAAITANAEVQRAYLGG